MTACALQGQKETHLCPLVNSNQVPRRSMSEWHLWQPRLCHPHVLFLKASPFLGLYLLIVKLSPGRGDANVLSRGVTKWNYVRAKCRNPGLYWIRGPNNRHLEAASWADWLHGITSAPAVEIQRPYLAHTGLISLADLSRPGCCAWVGSV